MKSSEKQDTTLARNEFRQAVFERDQHRCVVCGASAVDAHHIMERRLWPDGGYYLDNGASVCAVDHIRCETTEISVEALREASGITTKRLPPHLYDDQVYDKWGNPVLANGQRLRGELFYDESVQKVLQPILHLFTELVKYPRTYHLPWSPGMHDDDRQHTTTEQWQGQDVVVTLKMDGENTTMYREHIHARSLDSQNHVTRNWVKQFWSTIRYEIPVDWRVCGENLYAKHSIGYTGLPSYFLGFSIWNNRNECLPWQDTLEWFALLGITPVPELYRGGFDITRLQQISHEWDWERTEGYVLRPTAGFSYGQFRSLVGKYVRANHIKTTKHWMHGQPVERNQLRS